MSSDEKNTNTSQGECCSGRAQERGSAANTTTSKATTAPAGVAKPDAKQSTAQPVRKGCH